VIGKGGEISNKKNSKGIPLERLKSKGMDVRWFNGGRGKIGGMEYGVSENGVIKHIQTKKIHKEWCSNRGAFLDTRDDQLNKQALTTDQA